MEVLLKTPKDVRNYIEDLLIRVPEENAAGIAALLQVWMKAWTSDEIDSIETKLAALELSIEEHQAAFLEETEELMDEVEGDLR
jgi:hypothetical protein